MRHMPPPRVLRLPHTAARVSGARGAGRRDERRVRRVPQPADVRVAGGGGGRPRPSAHPQAPCAGAPHRRGAFGQRRRRQVHLQCAACVRPRRKKEAAAERRSSSSSSRRRRRRGRRNVAGGADGRGHLRAEHSDDAGNRAGEHPRDGDGHDACRGVGQPCGRVCRVSARRRERRRRLARAAQERPHQAVPARRGLGRARPGLAGRRHAARHVRRAPLRRAVPQGQRGRRRHRHHAAGRCAGRRAQGDPLLPEGRPARARRRREHVWLRLPVLPPRADALPAHKRRRRGHVRRDGRPLPRKNPHRPCNRPRLRRRQAILCRAPRLPRNKGLPHPLRRRSRRNRSFILLISTTSSQCNSRIRAGRSPSSSQHAAAAIDNSAVRRADRRGNRRQRPAALSAADWAAGRRGRRPRRSAAPFRLCCAVFFCRRRRPQGLSTRATRVSFNQQLFSNTPPQKDNSPSANQSCSVNFSKKRTAPRRAGKQSQRNKQAGKQGRHIGRSPLCGALFRLLSHRG